jgi:hypothetical protein
MADSVFGYIYISFIYLTTQLTNVYYCARNLLICLGILHYSYDYNMLKGYLVLLATRTSIREGQPPFGTVPLVRY